MLTIIRSLNSDLIVQLLSEGFEEITRTWRPYIDDNTYYLIPYFYGDPCGIICLFKLTEVMADCHIYLRKEFRGKDSIVLGKLALEWIKNNTKINKLITFTPEDKPLAKRWANKLGFKQIKRLEGSFMRNDKLIATDMSELV